MTASLDASCPECKKAIKGSTDLAGKKVRCKGCGHVFIVAASVAQSEGGARRAALDDTAGSAYGLVPLERALPLCPFCAQELPSESATLCVQCGFNLRTRQRLGTKKVLDRTWGDQLAWLLPGFLALIGIFLLLALDLFYCFSLPRLVAETVWEPLSAKVFQVVVIMLSLLAIIVLAKVALQRLVLSPLPPEQETH